MQDATHLRLIDYDGMFVPQLAQLPNAELGQRNFQHPARRAWHFDGELDRFSFSVIDLALDALCRRPALWEQTESDADAFLLRAADLTDPANSPVFSLLASVPGLEQRVHDLAAICMAPFDQIPALEDFLEGRNIPAVPVVFSGDASVALRSKYTSVHEIVDAVTSRAAAPASGSGRTDRQGRPRRQESCVASRRGLPARRVRRAFA